MLRCIPPVKLEDTILGQYTRSEDDDSKIGYLEDKTVPAGSTCPTFAACTLWINNERWEGVPFILKCGKGRNYTNFFNCFMKFITNYIYVL